MPPRLQVAASAVPAAAHQAVEVAVAAGTAPAAALGELIEAGFGETFELKQLKSAPSQLLPVFFHDLTGCKLVAISLDRPIPYIYIFSSAG